MPLWTLLPDELSRAYVWRLRNSNVLSGNDALGKQLGVSETPSGRPADSTNRVTALLHHLDMDGLTFVCRHSLVPVNKCVATFDRKASSTPRFGDRWYLGFALWSGGAARLCRDCVLEDLSFLGFSYWRRSHQLPGITWCIKHRRPLSEFRHYSQYQQSPLAALACAEEIPNREVVSALKSVVVQRYSSVLESILDNAEGPTHSAAAAQVIRTQATAKGLKVMPGHRAPYLSDAAMELLPKRWLGEHFPASHGKRSREFASWMDQAGHARTKPVSSTTFALALALLWDDPDEAVGTFLRANSEQGTPSQPASALAALDDESVRTLWLRNKGQIKRIAEEIGLSARQVQNKLHRSGFPALGPKQFDKTKAAVDSFRRGESLASASGAAGLPADKVEALIRALLPPTVDDHVPLTQVVVTS